MLNVKIIIINVSKRVYYEKNNKRQQTLIINVDIFSNGL